MKRFLLPLATVFCMNTAYAGGTLKITNQVEDLEVNVITDLICNYFLYTEGYPNEGRYTSPLSENPILFGAEPVKIHWRNCRIAEEEFFTKAETSDHSRLYVRLQNQADQHKQVILTVKNGEQKKIVHFDGKTIELVLSHSGEYIFSENKVYTTDTELRILPKTN